MGNEMLKRIDEYFANTSDEQLRMDAQAAGFIFIPKWKYLLTFRWLPLHLCKEFMVTKNHYISFIFRIDFKRWGFGPMIEFDRDGMFTDLWYLQTGLRFLFIEFQFVTGYKYEEIEWEGQ